MIQSTPSHLERAGNTYVQAIVRYIARPEDPPDLQVRKGLLVGSVVLVLPATIVWGAAYAYYGETLAALITYGYMLLSVVGLINLRRTGQLESLATIQIVCTLLIPFALTLVLGGIVGWCTHCEIGQNQVDIRKVHGVQGRFRILEGQHFVCGRGTRVPRERDVPEFVVDAVHAVFVQDVHDVR